MKPVLLLALVVAAASILAAGCVSPGDNATQPTTIPTETGTPVATTPIETDTATMSVTTAATTATGGEAVTIDLTADIMAFDTETITVPAGAEVTVNFDNQDDGIPHNLAVYTDSSAATAIFVGDTVTGPVETTYTFTAPSEPGTYYFRCDVHPEMNGDFVVE
ncbi:cupredoxin domain-containing protein [Methanoculleus formosensis]|nr:cupredoxin domain-containing protein [Methanoculleus sp. Afa-1]